MRRAAEDGAVLLVHSDHGFKWGSDRPCGLASGNWSTAAFWHRPEGVFAVWGAGVRTGRPRGAARLVDVAPTVLALLAVPGDRRMTGEPVAAAFEKPLRLTRADRSQLAVARVAAQAASDAESSEYAKKLLALGYLSPGETAALAPSGGALPGLTEGAWNNLGTYELQTKKNFAAAKAAFEESLKLRPDYYSPMFNLAVLAREQGDARAAEEWLLRSLRAVPGDPSTAVIGWAREWAKRGKPVGVAVAAGPGVGGLSRQRGDRPRAGAFPSREQELRRRRGGARAVRGDDVGPADAQRPRALRDLPAAPRGGRAAAGAISRVEARSAGRRPRPRDRPARGAGRPLIRYFLFWDRNFSSIVASA